MITITDAIINIIITIIPIATSAKKIPFGRNGYVRAVRNTPVADYSAPGVNTTRRVVYRPPITVSLSLRILSVSCFKQSLWHCGQLWQYVGMGSLGMRLHQDSNAMCDAANISPRVPSTCAQNAILFTNYTHHSKSPDLCGYWQSIARSVRLMSYY